MPLILIEILILALSAPAMANDHFLFNKYKNPNLVGPKRETCDCKCVQRGMEPIFLCRQDPMTASSCLSGTTYPKWKPSTAQLDYCIRFNGGFCTGYLQIFSDSDWTKAFGIYNNCDGAANRRKPWITGYDEKRQPVTDF